MLFYTEQLSYATLYVRKTKRYNVNKTISITLIRNQVQAWIFRTSRKATVTGFFAMDSSQKFLLWDRFIPIKRVLSYHKLAL